MLISPTLYGTNLANAATAINVPTKVIAKQGGVYLFSLPYSDDKATLAQYTSELDAATTGFTLPYNGDPNTLDQYEADLNSNNVARVTVLDVSNMNSQTICPNESTLAVNQQGGKTWDPLWLRATTPPQPPTCVPTDYKWCPPKTQNQSHKKSHKIIWAFCVLHSL